MQRRVYVIPAFQPSRTNRPRRRSLTGQPRSFPQKTRSSPGNSFIGEPMRRSSKLYALSIVGVLCLAAAPLWAQTAGRVLEGRAAFGDWRADRPGTRRLIRPDDLPSPEHAQSVA